VVVIRFLQADSTDRLLALYTTVCVNLAVGLEESGNFEGAAAAIQKALGVDAQHARALAVMEVITAALDPSTAAKYLTPIPAPKPPSPEPAVVEVPSVAPVKSVPKWQQPQQAGGPEPVAHRWQAPSVSSKPTNTDGALSSKPESPSPGGSVVGNRWQTNKGSAPPPAAVGTDHTPSELGNRWKSPSAMKTEPSAKPAPESVPAATDSPVNRWRTSSKDGTNSPAVAAPAPIPAAKDETPTNRWKSPAVKPAETPKPSPAPDETAKPVPIATRWQKPTTPAAESSEPQLPVASKPPVPSTGAVFGGGLKPAVPSPATTPKWQPPAKSGDSPPAKPSIVASMSPQPSKPIASSPLARHSTVPAPAPAPAVTGCTLGCSHM
jgi:hypothetical protein